MIKRLPLILFILTLVSCGAMILIRIGGAGLRLLSAKTGTGRFIAATYNSCIVVFAVILCLFIIVTVLVNRNRKRRRGAMKAETETVVSPVTTETAVIGEPADQTGIIEKNEAIPGNENDPSDTENSSAVSGDDESWNDQLIR